MRLSATYGLLGLSEKRGFGFYVFPHSVSVIHGDKLPLLDGRLAVGAPIPKQTVQTVPLQLVGKVKVGVEFDLSGPADHLTVQQIIDERLTRRCGYDQCGLPTRYAIAYLQPNVRWLGRAAKVPICLLHLEDMLPRPDRDWEVYEFPSERRFSEGKSLGRVVFDPVERRILTLEEHQQGEVGDGCIVIEKSNKPIAFFNTKNGVLEVKQPFFERVDSNSGSFEQNLFFDTDDGRRIILRGVTKTKQFLHD